MFRNLKRNTGNTETSKKWLSFKGLNKLQRSNREILEQFQKFNKIPWKTYIVEYFDLILARETSPCF